MSPGVFRKSEGYSTRNINHSYNGKKVRLDESNGNHPPNEYSTTSVATKLYLRGFQSNSITICIQKKGRKGYLGTASNKDKGTNVIKQNKIHHGVFEAL